MIKSREIGTYDIKYKFDSGNDDVVTFKVIDFIKEGKAFEFKVYKDGKGNDVLHVNSRVKRSTQNINVEFGKNIIIKNAPVGNDFTYVFKKGHLEEIKLNPKDINTVKYEITKGKYDFSPASIINRRVEDGIVTAIKLDDSSRGYEGYLTIGDCERDIKDNNFIYSTGELYTIKLDKKESGEWIGLEKGIPEDRLFIANHLYKKTKKKK